MLTYEMAAVAQVIVKTRGSPLASHCFPAERIPTAGRGRGGGGNTRSFCVASPPFSWPAAISNDRPPAQLPGHNSDRNDRHNQQSEQRALQSDNNEKQNEEEKRKVATTASMAVRFAVPAAEASRCPAPSN